MALRNHSAWLQHRLPNERLLTNANSGPEKCVCVFWQMQVLVTKHCKYQCSRSQPGFFLGGYHIYIYILIRKQRGVAYPEEICKTCTFTCCDRLYNFCQGATTLTPRPRRSCASPPCPNFCKILVAGSGKHCKKAGIPDNIVGGYLRAGKRS